VSTVVPVIGLVAESAETATLTESDAKAVAALARIDPERFERMLWSADRFVNAECDVSQHDRERLLALLDLYAIRRSVAMAATGVSGATALRRALSEMSGIAKVKGLLAEYFGRKDHLLKARSAVAVAERVSYWTADAVDPEAPGRLRTRLEQLRVDPTMHPLNELDAWQECRSGHVNLDPDMQEEADRLFEQGTLAARVGVAEGDLEAVAQAAAAGIKRWRTFSNTRATPAQAGVARVVIHSYELIWSAAKEQPSMTA
jgi:hypothetical protein